MKKILIIGAGGFVGGNLLHLATQYNSYTIIPAFHSQIPVEYKNIGINMDIRIYNEVEKTIQETRPDYIVNLSCVNKTDSEKDPERAHAVQVVGAQNCARVCKENVIRFIQFSTDMVYSGNKGTPYTLDDVPDPNIVYGKTKWEADQAIAQIGGSYVIIRSPMVLGLKRLTRGSFVDWMLENIRNNTPFPLFIDNYRTPIVVDDLIDIIFRLAESDVIGTLLAGGNQDMNRVQMGRMFLDAMGKPYDLIREVYLKEVKSDVLWQKDLRMDNTKLKEILGIKQFTPIKDYFEKVAKEIGR